MMRLCIVVLRRTDRNPAFFTAFVVDRISAEYGRSPDDVVSNRIEG